MTANKIERASLPGKQTALALCILILFTLMISCGKKTETVSTGGNYACPMLCVITDHPGECPVCGMEMALVQSGTSADRASIELDEIAVTRSGIRTAPSVKAVARRTVSMFGKVIPDETRTAAISAWSNGRIDQLYADTTGMVVQKGQILAALYSPELIRAQQELIQAVKSQDLRMQTIMREKLRRYGIDDAQIDAIAKQTEPREQLNITATATGTVLMKNVTAGDYVTRGQPLYRIADLSSVWIELQAYETDLPQISIGQMAVIEPGTVRGTVSFVAPSIDPQSRTAGVRVVVPNPGGTFRPEQLVRGTIHVMDKKEAVLIPASAPLHTGEKALVYVKIGENVFEGRSVTLGARAGEQIIVLHGIDAGEDVVVHGAFRIDAAMQISGRASMMNPAPAEGEPAAPMQHQH